MPTIVSQGSDTMRVLVLGGTEDANRLARALAERGIEATYSYAGRTAVPAAQPLPVRTGGFGGADGLARFLRDHGYTHLVDATHPFAGEMSRNAIAACRSARIACLALERPEWTEVPGDRWIHVPDLEAAAAALPDQRSRVFLAIGRQHVSAFASKPQHVYTLRFVDRPDADPPLPYARVIVDRGPFGVAGELDLMRQNGIEWLVTRNAGGEGARAKLTAARELWIPVVMIGRPALPDRSRVATVDEVLRWLDHETCLGA
jgi:precorrin-6A/cobalt-precorrin-6A reductase